MTGVGDRLSWNLTARRTLTARKLPGGKLQPIARQLLPGNSNLMMVGFQNPKAKANWWFGGYVTQLLNNALPSSTSVFGGFPAGHQERCRLNGLTLIRFPNYGILPFTIQVDIAPWHEKMVLEAWWYDGDDPDEALRTLSEIKSRLTNIENKLNG
ncbi:hypothetical protein [Nodularia sphaerocarpa]|uniref:hypothetical protein n=1 Tax=Nodularia sphaerocarpa TaxID=137816 RepID=UPI001EFB39ED|nr:hypothetical protein [Nodularia sphaerocarpa]MDB9374309.1 hypothetical protein [Nodularia sphaerocarpa CS-585]MDB9376465.1 hypothetical protein [Nodularia sphaerocarpa CS-585A2]ULP74145.1 hypothetical protein BDGGKGIB_03808 [Nodularia sphaerocarpa UHCC 0038]